MTDTKRLLELALKGLETERGRLDEEMAEIRKQLQNGAGRPRQKPASPPQSASAPKAKTSNLTTAGRRRLSMLMKRRWAERRKAAAKGGK